MPDTSSTVKGPMPGSTEVRARLWEWQSFQGLVFAFSVCIAFPLLLALAWVHITFLLVATGLLASTLLPIAVGFFLGLNDTPRSVSSTPDLVRLTFHGWRGKARTRELRPDSLGELRILSFGWFGSALTDRVRWGEGGIGAISLTKQQARIFEGRARKVSWLRG